MIGFIIGYLVALTLRAVLDISKEKEAIKIRMIKLDGKYYGLIPVNFKKYTEE